MQLLAAKCPSCGADIQVPDNKDFAYCTFCGSNVKVRESVIVKSDVDVENLIALGNVELQAKDYNNAIEYFTRVLEVDGKNHHAWMGKGTATLRRANTSLEDYREAYLYYEHALDNIPEEKKDGLYDTIFDEYSIKKYFAGHIEFLDQLINIRPDEELLLTLIRLLDIVEADMSKSGNKLSLERLKIRENALLLLKTNYPEEYDRYYKLLNLRQAGLEKQTEQNEKNELEKKRKDLFSGKRAIKDFIVTALLYSIITFIIIFIIDTLGNFTSSGFGRFIAIFGVLFIFANIAVYFKKRREFSEFKEYLSRKKRPFKDMAQ